jgi:hypothetical protein
MEMGGGGSFERRKKSRNKEASPFEEHCYCKIIIPMFSVMFTKLLVTKYVLEV